MVSSALPEEDQITKARARTTLVMGASVRGMGRYSARLVAVDAGHSTAYVAVACAHASRTSEISMENHLKTLLLNLADEGIAFVVGGGVGMVLHGVERVTLDLDVAVDMQPANLRRFLDVMEKLALKPRVPVPGTDLLDPSKVTAMIKQKRAVVFTFVDPAFPLRQVDVFLREDHRFAHLCADAESVTLWGRSFRVVSKRRLLALKRGIQPPRPKDQFDIAALEQLLEAER